MCSCILLLTHILPAILFIENYVSCNLWCAGDISTAKLGQLPGLPRQPEPANRWMYMHYLIALNVYIDECCDWGRQVRSPLYVPELL